MRASRSGVRSGSVRRDRTNACQSRIGRAHDVVDGGDEGAPGIALPGQYFPAFRRELVAAALALARLLDPAAFDPTPVLELQQQGIQRRQGERNAATGP